MKLPVIRQGQVQSLGQHDINAPLREGQAKVAVSQQTAAGAQQLAGIVTREASKYAVAKEQMVKASEKAQTLKAMSLYKTQVAEGMAAAQDFDEAGEPIWENQEDKIYRIKRDAQAAAGGVLTSDNSRTAFEEAKFSTDNEADARWANKVNTAQLKDTEATAFKNVEDFKQAHDWDAIAGIANDPHMKQVLTPKATRQFNAIAKRGRLMDSYESSRLTSAQDPVKSLALKEKALNDLKLSPSDKRALVAAINTGQINYETEQFTSGLVQVEELNGLDGAVATADRMIDDYIRRPAEELGGDERYKSNLVDTLQAVRNDFARGLKKTSNDFSRGNINANILNGTLRVSPRKNAKEYNGLYLSLVGGQFDDKGKYIEGSLDEGTLLDSSGQKYDVAMALTNRFGFLPEHFEKLLGTTLLNGSEDEKAVVINTFADLSSKNPATVFNNPQSSFAKDLFALVQLSGQTQAGRDEALKLYNTKAALGESEKQMYRDMRFSRDFTDTFDGSFTSIMKKKYPATSGFFGNAAPDVQQGMQARAKALAGEYLPLAQGDYSRAINMALESLKHEYGNYDGKFVHHPAGKVMSEMNNLTPGQNDAWIKQQLAEETIGAQVAGGGDPNYNTDYLEMVPSTDFNTADPKYTIIDKNPAFGGMIKALSIYQPEYESTPQARETRRVEQVNAVRADIRAQQTKDSQQWQSENPSLLIVKDPALRYVFDPYEGVFNRMRTSTQEALSDTSRKLFGPPKEGTIPKQTFENVL